MEKEEGMQAGFEEDGFAIINDVFSFNEVENISLVIESFAIDNPATRSGQSSWM